MAEIKWTPQAIEDIEIIAKYIANDSPKYAAIQVEEFFDAALILEDFPHSGRRSKSLRRKNSTERQRRS